MILISRRRFALSGGAFSLVSLGLPGRLTAAVARKDSLNVLDSIEPELRPAAAQFIRIYKTTGPITSGLVPSVRAAGAQFAAAWDPNISVEAHQVPVGGVHPDVTVYLINARRARRKSRPAILHMHGGGFISGQAKWEVGRLQRIAGELDCVIATVEYRLAPETQFSGSVEDNYAALSWLHTNSESLGVDRNRIALLGESAGGGHAALLAIKARDQGQVPICAQILIYPMLDDRTGSSRVMPFPIGSVAWTAEDNVFCWRCFLGQSPGERNVPTAAVPARAASLAGLPSTFIGVGSVDLFISENLIYARRLAKAGTPTEVQVVPGAFHGFDSAAPRSTAAQRFTNLKINALRRAFGQIAA